MRKNSIIVPLVLYVLATIGMLLIVFVFLKSQGVDWENFFIAVVLLIPTSGAIGYLLLGDIAGSKTRQDERLESLTREVLHEINLPVSTIQSNLQMLEVRIDDQHNLKRIKRAREALKRLQRLYEELAYTIRRELHSVEKVKLNLSDLVLERVEVYKEMGRNKFVVEVEPLYISVDKIGLEQVLDNIIENSMKYSDPDTPIYIRIDGSRLVIADQGIGMDAAQIARIWERYYQGDSHSPGEGIGLALVKRYCDESGIGINISSSPGKGTVVSLDFDRVIQK